MKIIKKLIFVVLCLLSLVGASDVLVWQVDSNASIDGMLIQNFLSENSSDDDTHWPVARVRAIDSNTSESRYLDIYLDAENDKWPGNEGQYLGDILNEQGGIEGWGAMWMQSEIPSELGQELLFAIELGEITWDEAEDTVAFKLLAESDTYTREQIRQHTYPQFDLNPPVYTPWNPLIYHTTPEPSSLLLTLFGTGLLLLRRKQL